MILAFLLACAPDGPPVDDRRQALDAWTRGHEALSAGDPVRAAAAFERALAARPDDPVLGAWKAKAWADAGDLPTAIRTADQVLRAHPEQWALRYNRACWQARVGRPEDAAVDLRIALQSPEAASALHPASDPDLQPYRDHPAFGVLLQPAAMEASWTPPVDVVFAGSDAEARIAVAGQAAASDLTLQGDLTGPFGAMDVTDESLPNGTRRLTFRLRAEGPGHLTFGPLTVESPGTRPESFPAATTQVRAAPSRPEAPQVREAARTPDQARGGHVVPDVWEDAEGTWVLTSPHEQAVGLAGHEPDARWTRRTSEGAWTVARYPRGISPTAIARAGVHVWPPSSNAP